MDKSAFLTDSLIKDLVGWVLYAIGFSLYAFFTPIALGHPDNSIHANPLTTPAHIVPEWYFLAFYAILRSIPNKQAGVASVALVFFTLGLIGISGSSTFRHGPVRPSSSAFSPTIADAFHLFWILGADLLILGWSGSHCTPHAIRIGQLWSAYSFLCLANLRAGAERAGFHAKHPSRPCHPSRSTSVLTPILRWRLCGLAMKMGIHRLGAQGLLVYF